MIKPPCPRDCESRTPDCHSACGKYLEYRKKVDAENKAKRRSQMFAEYTIAAVERTKIK